jgi:SAM-dependent methyltransferase
MTSTATSTARVDGTGRDVLDAYVCPACRRSLTRAADSLRCDRCAQTYPVRAGIPEFIAEELWTSRDPALRRMTAIDKMARIYETRLWYPIVLALYGGFGKLSLAQLIAKVTRNLGSAEGRILDIACGPGTFGRRTAGRTREVFGIDVSRGMLRQGLAYTEKEGITNMHFARARVEALPFPAEAFDAALCCGSLHLFSDTVAALREMARVMKPAAVLSVFTFTVGDAGILKYRPVLDYNRRHGLHTFELPEMAADLDSAGFERFEADVSGSILTFAARRKAQ